MQPIIGIDAGTSAVKAVLIDGDTGFPEAQAYVQCPPAVSDEYHAVISPEQYYNAFVSCLIQIKQKKPDSYSNVKALAVSSQGVTFTALDAKGIPLMDMILMYDSRAKAEAEELAAVFGESITDVTGQPECSPILEACKLLWLKKNEPGLFARIGKILLVHDYLLYRLSGEYVSNPSIQSSSLLYNIRTRTWWGDMLDYLGIDETQLPRIVESGIPAGCLTKKAADETGLPENALVVSGALDQVCGMAGVGNIVPGVMSESTGSVLAVHTVCTSILDGIGGVMHFCGIEPGMYTPIAVCPAAAAAVDWFRDTFLDGKEATFTNGISHLAKQVSPGADGLLIIPNLAGRGSPHPDSGRGAVMHGIRVNHDAGHFVRAFLEGVAYQLRENVDVFSRNGIGANEIYAMGGGAKSGLWNSIKAAVCGMTVVTSEVDEPGCAGAAILAGVGAGLLSGIQDGCERLNKAGKRFEPDQGLVTLYDELYNNYLELSDAVYV